MLKIKIKKKSFNRVVLKLINKLIRSKTDRYNNKVNRKQLQKTKPKQNNILLTTINVASKIFFL